jgi:hypothetical protein
LSGHEVLERLFILANSLADREEASAYARIGEVRGPHAWMFLEHLSELPEEGRRELLRALIKRRFAMEGFRTTATALTASEELEIQHWLKHDNSMHGTRVAPCHALSVREEQFQKRKALLLLPSKPNIRAVFREHLKSSPIPIQILRDARSEISWCTGISSLSVHETLDLGNAWGGLAEGLVVVRDAKLPLNIPTSFLRLFGIGATSWDFLEQGEEHLCASATIRFFSEVCNAVLQ